MLHLDSHRIDCGTSLWERVHLRSDLRSPESQKATALKDLCDNCVESKCGEYTDRQRSHLKAHEKNIWAMITSLPRLVVKDEVRCGSMLLISEKRWVRLTWWTWWLCSLSNHWIFQCSASCPYLLISRHVWVPPETQNSIVQSWAILTGKSLYGVQFYFRSFSHVLWTRYQSHRERIECYFPLLVPTWLPLSTFHSYVLSYSNHLLQYISYDIV